MTRALIQILLFCGVLSFSDVATGGNVTAAADAREADIDRVVMQAMKIFSVPGVAVGVVRDGKTVLAKGYGVADLTSHTPVDTDTLFSIASNTKAFTAAALAILVDEGKIAWNDRVTDHIPRFRLADAYVTREFTILDLLTHRSGLAPYAGDLMVWPATDFSRSEIITSLRHLKFASSFRSAYAYDNLLYIVAGEIIPATTGSSWEDFIDDRLLAPLDMRSCAALRNRVAATASIAAPHTMVDGALQQVSPYDMPASGAAGGMLCNIGGMLKWLSMQLNGGTAVDGTPLFTPRRQVEMWTPHTILPVSGEVHALNKTHFRLYGLGWQLESYHGLKRIRHNGVHPGMVSHITLIPEENLGVVVLTNQESSAARNAITEYIVSAYAGTENRDWIKVFQEIELASTRAESEAVSAVADKPPSLPLTEYTGTYSDPWRGEVWIRERKGKLSLTFSRTTALEGVMEHFRDDVFIVRWNDRSLLADAYVRFRLDYDGVIEEVTMKAVSPHTDPSFNFHDLSLRPVASE